MIKVSHWSSPEGSRWISCHLIGLHTGQEGVGNPFDYHLKGHPPRLNRKTLSWTNIRYCQALCFLPIEIMIQSFFHRLRCHLTTLLLGISSVLPRILFRGWNPPLTFNHNSQTPNSPLLPFTLPLLLSSPTYPSKSQVQSQWLNSIECSPPRQAKNNFRHGHRCSRT